MKKLFLLPMLCACVTCSAAKPICQVISLADEVCVIIKDDTGTLGAAPVTIKMTGTELKALALAKMAALASAPAPLPSAAPVFPSASAPPVVSAPPSPPPVVSSAPPVASAPAAKPPVKAKK